ncbi:MAG: SgcJ/EcaC family oxidoreductase [Isosphaeraceae bacterium]
MSISTRFSISPRARTATLAIPSAFALALALSLAFGATTTAQDMKPDPADAQAVRELMMTASQALLKKDSKGFVDCCDDYVDVFFLDGTLLKGKKKIASTLYEFFQNRPDDLSLTLDVVPRSFRVLSPEIVMVDWPATVKGPKAEIRVNTLTTLRKVEGKWSITSYLESVPFTSPVGGRNVVPKSGVPR